MTEPHDDLSESLTSAAAEKAALIAELQQAEIKHTPENILRIAKRSDGKIVFLELGKGGERGSGLKHILDNHKVDFANRGISEEQIPDAIMKAVTGGNIVGYQQPDRPIYQIIFNDRTHLIAVTVSENGYIVCANPRASI